MQQPPILVVGSLAFDVIFSIPHDFRQSVPLEDGQIRSFNATYVANEKDEFPGGTAGNIAAWLGTIDVGCSVFSAWGEDLSLKGYQDRLEQVGAQLRGSVGAFTAHCYSVSDPLHQQLVIWQPNHYESNKTQALLDHYSSAELAQFQWAIFAAGTPDSIQKHMSEFRACNPTAKVILDPGQVSPFFTSEGFQACMKMADIVIGNDIEETHFNRYMEDVWPQHVQRIITLGAQGVRFWQRDSWHTLPAQPVEKVVETTGAGDAFRAGLLGGLFQEGTLEEALDLGLQLGAECVQCPAGQPV